MESFFKWCHFNCWVRKVESNLFDEMFILYRIPSRVYRPLMRLSVCLYVCVCVTLFFHFFCVTKSCLFLKNKSLQKHIRRYVSKGHLCSNIYYISIFMFTNIPTQKWYIYLQKNILSFFTNILWRFLNIPTSIEIYQKVYKYTGHFANVPNTSQMY